MAQWKQSYQFSTCSSKPTWEKIIIMQRVYYFSSILYFFLNSVGPFCTHVSSICPTAKDKKQTGNAVSAHGHAWTILTVKFKAHATIATNNNNTDKLQLHFCSKLYFILLKNFRHINLYSSMSNEKFEWRWFSVFNPYPTAFPYGNGMVLHFYQQQESSMTKTVHKVINKGLKMYV